MAKLRPVFTIHTMFGYQLQIADRFDPEHDYEPDDCPKLAEQFAAEIAHKGFYVHNTQNENAKASCIVINAYQITVLACDMVYEATHTEEGTA